MEEEEWLDIKQKLMFAGTHLISVDKLKPSRYQPRYDGFDETQDILDLAESIKSVGLIELPIVRKILNDSESFEIVAGHRRIWAVSQHLGWKKVKCEVYENIDELTAFRLAMTDNIQRSNLSQYEEGTSYLMCQEIFGLSDLQISQQLHRSTSTVRSRKQFAKSANGSLKFLDGSDKTKFLRNLTVGHQAVLTEIADSAQIREAVRMIEDGVTPKELKSFVSNLNVNGARPERSGTTLISLERQKRGRSDKSRLMDQLARMIQRLKESAPDELRAEIYQIEDLFDLLRSKSKQSQNNITPDFRLKSYHESTKECICPNCGRTLQVERRLNERDNSVIFSIKPKLDGHMIDNSTNIIFHRIL